MSIEISSTDSIPDEVLSALADELPEEFQACAADYKISLCSVEPPAWFTLIAELDWWLKILGGYAAVYLASVANAAGKETWEQRSEITAYLCKVARSILNAKRKCRQNTHVELAIKLPDSYYEAKLYLSGEREEDVAKEIALFVHYAPDVVKLFKKYKSSGMVVSGWVGLKIRPDNSMEVNWMDSESLDNVQHVLQKNIS